MPTSPSHAPYFRCTGAQAACNCGFRGPVHKGPQRHKKAKADLRAHAALSRSIIAVHPATKEN